MNIAAALALVALTRTAERQGRRYIHDLNEFDIIYYVCSNWLFKGWMISSSIR